MSDFRTKLLGLAALGIAVAGLSSAQTITCTLNGSTSGGIIVGSGFAPLNPATLRSESQTELAQDVTTQGAAACNSTAVTTGIVYVTLSATVTSKLTNAQTGQTEAAIVLNAGANAGVPIYGTIFGPNELVFSGVAFPAGTFGFEIYNVRVNAATSTSTSVTETVNIEYVSNPNTTGSANLISGALQVGFIQQSLSFALANIQGNGNSAKTFNSYLVCAGNPLPLTSSQNYLISVNGAAGVTNLSFQVNLTELTPGAFKQQLAMGAVPGPAIEPTAGGENGSLISGANGTATGPTNIVLTLANVPSSATVYLPLTTVSGNVTLTLLNSSALSGSQFQPNANYNPPPGYTNLPYPNSIGVGAAAVGNVVGFTPANGGVTATYTVTATAPIPPGQQTFAIPVEMVFAKNSAPSQTTAVTVLAAYAPSAAALTGPATGIPTFAVSTQTPIPASIISPCQTTLLFPYVTNYQGTYETGIAIANTTTDNLGTANASTATPTNGSCMINFYGNQAQPAAWPTPTVGAWSTAAGSPSPVYANTLTAMTGLTNFSGYAIANCNFLDAHGFAFITDYTLGGSDAFAQGYLAVVVPNSRTVADSGAGTGNGE